MTYTAVHHAQRFLSRWQFARVLAAMLTAMVMGVAMFSAPATAQLASIEKEFPLPPAIAGMAKGQATDFEAKKAGLGYGFIYSMTGARADIFIYDLGMKNIPDGPKNDIITSQLERAKQDIYTVQKKGGYTGVQLKSSFDVNNAAGKPLFLCAYFQLVRKDSGVSDSYLCVTGAAKKFVKVRIAMRQDANSKATVERFLTELGGVLPLR